MIGIEVAASTDENQPETLADKAATNHLTEDGNRKSIGPLVPEHHRMEMSTDYHANMNASATDGPAAERSNWEATMFRELLEIDIQQAVVWQDWDTARETTETPPILYVVGSAGSAAGIISVGYLLWILRGSTVITVLTSSAPRWRMVDPTAILTAYRGSIDYDDDHMEEMLG